MKNRDVLNGAGESARGGSVQGNFSATARGSVKVEMEMELEMELEMEMEVNMKDEKLPEK